MERGPWAPSVSLVGERVLPATCRIDTWYVVVGLRDPRCRCADLSGRGISLGGSRVDGPVVRFDYSVAAPVYNIFVCCGERNGT